MSDPSPKKSDKVSYRVSADGRHVSLDVDIFEFDTTLRDHLKPIYEERKRLRREARERAAREQQPKSDDAPIDENRTSS